MRPTFPARWLMLLALTLAGCERATPPASAPQPVLVVQPQAAAAHLQRYPGEVHARHEPQLAFQVGGKVVERRVEVGDRVAAGAPLARLDAEDLRLRRDAAQARVEAAQAALGVAQAEQQRYRALLERRLVSQSQFDAIENRYRSARADFEQATAERQVAANQLDHALLSAPQAGLIVARAVEEGQVVAAGQTVFVLAADGEREVAIHLPEQQFAAFRLGDAASIELWSQPGERFEGRLRELAAAADPASRTFAARVAFASQVAVEPGQSALVTLHNGGRQTLAVPLSAVSAEQGQPFVWRLRADHTLERVSVRLGAYGEEQVPVLEGLSAEDWIVLAGVHLLQENQPVRPLDRDNRPVRLGSE